MPARPQFDPADALAAVRSVTGDPTRFKVYVGRPVDFAKDILGITLWKKQAEIMEAAVRNRRVAVRSGHGIGKTLTCAALILYWLYAEQGLVVSTSKTKEQVEDVLWRTIHELLERAPVTLPGERSKTELKITPTWYATGITTADSGAFVGRHHPRLLVVIDEAPEVAEPIHLAASTLTVGARNCLVMIGNPTVTSGTFWDAFKHPHTWKLFAISCYDHPNVIAGKEIIKGAVTAEWIAERKELWTENHPFWFSRVLGEFPKISTRGVVPLGWIERSRDPVAWTNALKAAEEGREQRVGGLDVARYGDNRTVFIVRRGDAVEHIESWNHTTLTETAGKSKLLFAKWGLKGLVVDSAGIGAGVADILFDEGLNIYAYNGGHRAFTPASFTNRRSELWWHLRQRFERSRIWLPADDYVVGPLVTDLVAPEYKVLSTGRLQVETKEQLLERGVPSPDYADALVMCFALDENPDEIFEPAVVEQRDVLGDALIKPVPEHDEAPFSQLPGGW